uniref:Uncharacterized protein n=1 Tax=Anguilla anguilla TaxID=7936 RepID=A0A0E9V7J4_ANGAN
MLQTKHQAMQAETDNCWRP